MDQGIIANIKCHYRKRFIQDGMLPAMEKGEPMKWDILKMMKALKSAWHEVKTEIISNCFRHCGFLDPEDQPLATLIQPKAPQEAHKFLHDDVPLATLSQQLN